jgi:hypothetical protein
MNSDYSDYDLELMDSDDGGLVSTEARQIARMMEMMGR